MSANMFSLLPEELLDNEGYPTKEWLDYIENYEPDESLPLIKFIDSVLVDGWWMPDWGFKLSRKYNNKRNLELHTGGWSGNEDIISAIKSNEYLIYFHMKYVMWRRGGHYYFEISLT